MDTPQVSMNGIMIDPELQQLYNQLVQLNHKNKQLQEKIQDLELLVKMNYLLSHSLDKEETLDLIRDFFKENFNLDQYCLCLRTRNENEYEVASFFGLDFIKNSTITVNNHGHILAEVSQLRQYMYLPDLSLEKKYIIPWSEDHGSLLVLPLIVDKTSFLGTLSVYRKKKKAFQPSEIELYNFISLHISSVINKTILFRNTQELAFTDGLTGVFNRRYFDQRYAREVNRARRYGRSLSILMIDIDHFKKYNDSYGHLMGDQVLRRVAQTLEYKLRRADVVCRYGGEEFVVLLPEINIKDATHVADKLRISIQSSQLAEDEELKKEPITISVGVAGYPDSGDSEEIILRKADQALYTAKRNGRNRVEVEQE